MEAISALVHAHAPHSKQAIYLAAAICAVGAIVAVSMRCWVTKSHGHLQNSWLVRTASQAAPVPIYVLFMLAPFDPDLVQAIMEDQIVVALAGLYGLVETMKDVRGTASDARIKKDLMSGQS